MPRIDAPTLAEHRDMRRGSLLQAGRDLIATGGPRAVTMAALAERAGLSRPAVYEYFASSESLVGELLLEEMRRWAEELADAVGRARSPQDKVRTYVRTSLGMVGQGRHRLAGVVTLSDVSDDARRALVHLHHEMAAPLVQALTALGVDDPTRDAHLLQGVVEAATRRVEAGAAARAETRAAERFVMAGLAADVATPV